MNVRSVRRGLLLAIFASAAVFAVLAFVSNGSAVLGAARRIPAASLVAMLALTTVALHVRAIRWRLLMGTVGYLSSGADARFLQLGTQMMSVTPGRLGELMKPWMARDMVGMPMSVGTALVFTERMADLIAVCVLSLGGVTIIGGGWIAPVSAFALVVGAAVLTSSEWFHARAIAVLSRSSKFGRYLGAAQEVARAIRSTLSLRVSAWSVPFSAVAWGIEGFGFALCLKELGVTHLGVLAAVSIYAISTLAGALSFLPGGIGLTEVSMAGMLIAAGVDPAAASAATLITRLVTLWWGVGIGWLTLASRPSMLARLSNGDEP